MGNASKWKESLIERTILRQTTNLEQLVYGKSETKPADTVMLAKATIMSFSSPEVKETRFALLVCSSFTRFASWL
ncbi:hypothetical protein Tco_1250265, partial [Tanacetum coccineum]